MQIKIIALTYNVSYTYFESWIESISYIRNICAHYGRLYNAKLTKTPKLYQQYTKKHISNIRIFGVLCCIKHLVKNDIHWTNFVKSWKNFSNNIHMLIKIQWAFLPTGKIFY